MPQPEQLRDPTQTSGTGNCKVYLRHGLIDVLPSRRRAVPERSANNTPEMYVGAAP